MGVRIPTLSGPQLPPAPNIGLKASIDLLTDFLKRDGKTVVLTGAGVSVDSGIRAYRGKNGSYTTNKTHRPIFFSEPNPTHYAIAALQRFGAVDSLITQNVDGLHLKAWDPTLAAYLSPSARPSAPLSPDSPASDPARRIHTTPSLSPSPHILELHGTLRHAHCLSCGVSVGRDAFQDKLSELNPLWEKYTKEVEEEEAGVGKEERLNPDGDVELGKGVKYEEFNVPKCESCGVGDMKPTVTFFGESLDPAGRALGEAYIKSASQLLIVGSALATFSAYRLVRQMKDQGGFVGLVNVGESRCDPLVDWRIGWEGGAGDIFPQAVRRVWEEKYRTLGHRTKGEVEEVETMMRSGKVKSVKGGHAAS